MSRASYGELNDPEADYPGYLSKLRGLVCEGLAHADHGVRIKYEWLRERYNQALTACKQTCAQGGFRDGVRDAYEPLEFV